MELAFPAMGALLGALAAFLMVFLWNFIRAPYRQRDEAREWVKCLETERERLIAELLG